MMVSAVSVPQQQHTQTSTMLFNSFLSFGLLSLSLGQEAMDNGAEALVPTPAAGLEKRRITGWTTRLVTYYPNRHHGECHDHHRPCDTRTIFVVPSTITEVRKQTIYTYQTIPVPIPVPPCPCAVPDCRQNGCSPSRPPPCGCSPSSPPPPPCGCSQSSPPPCGYTPANPCNGTNGGGGNNVISTSTLPCTTPAPSSSVIILSTKTSSVTIYTQSSPPDAENAAYPTSKVDFKAVMLSLIAAAAVLMA